MKKLLFVIIAVVASQSAALAITASGGITVIPATPGATDRITIRLSNSFGAEARLNSASIRQTGNTFFIDQNVLVGCTLPSNPTVTSEFQVGPLPVGSYTVSATITFTGQGGGPCDPPPVTQTLTFAVQDPAAIPALDWRGLIALAAALGVSGLLVMKR